MLNSRSILLTLFLIGFRLGFCQDENLIFNPSFELYSNQIDCNGGFDVASVPLPIHIVAAWYTYQSPDYFNSVCPVGTYNIPSSFLGSSQAKHGNAFSGINVFDIRFNYQEYIYQNFSVPLKADSIYCLSFFVSRADRLPFAIKQIGAFFSNSLPVLSSGYINELPQVVNTSGFLTDTVNWIEIKGCFTAQGGEQYITIGNFNSNANTDTLRIPSTNPLTGTGTDVAYYYIDSVTLWQNNFPTFIKEDLKSEIVSVYPNPAKDVINFKFTNATEKRKVELYDAVGELVLSEDVSTQNSSLNIYHLANGIYFYCILVNGNTVNTNKIVIIK